MTGETFEEVVFDASEVVVDFAEVVDVVGVVEVAPVFFSAKSFSAERLCRTKASAGETSSSETTASPSRSILNNNSNNNNNNNNNSNDDNNNNKRTF